MGDESEYVNNKCLRAGMTREESVQAYSEMSDEYNQYVAGLKYKAPHRTAEVAAELIPDMAHRVTAQVLDMACGTGLVAESLHMLGFRNIDGIDPSQGMLDVAQAGGLYRQTLCSYVGVEGQQLPIADNYYDVVTLCGGMGQNMMPCEGLHEMIRLVKPGGYIINVFREEILTSVEEYKDRLEPLMTSLEEGGKWRRLRRDVYPQYQVDRVGLINVHQVC